MLIEVEADCGNKTRQPDEYLLENGEVMTQMRHNLPVGTPCMGVILQWKSSLWLRDTPDVSHGQLLHGVDKWTAGWLRSFTPAQLSRT